MPYNIIIYYPHKKEIKNAYIVGLIHRHGWNLVYNKCGMAFLNIDFRDN